MEQAALEGAREAGKKLFQALLALAEKALPKEHICKCGGRLESPRACAEGVNDDSRTTFREHFVIEAEKYGVFK